MSVLPAALFLTGEPASLNLADAQAVKTHIYKLHNFI